MKAGEERGKGGSKIVGGESIQRRGQTLSEASLKGTKLAGGRTKTPSQKAEFFTNQGRKKVGEEETKSASASSLGRQHAFDPSVVANQRG